MDAKILTTGTSAENNAFILNWQDSIISYGKTSRQGIIFIPLKYDEFTEEFNKLNKNELLSSFYDKNIDSSMNKDKFAFKEYRDSFIENNKNYYKEFFSEMGYRANEPENYDNIFQFVCRNIRQQTKLGLYQLARSDVHKNLCDVKLKVPVYVVTFTSKGLELLTQLKQHEDNINHNNRATRLNKILTLVAGISLLSTPISLYLSYKLITPTQKAATATESLAKDSRETLRILKSKQVKNAQLPVEQFILFPKNEQKINNNLYIYADRTETNK